MLHLKTSDEGLSAEAQSLLQGLRLAVFLVEVPCQELLVLPQAGQLEVCFNYLYEPLSKVGAALSWDALVQTAGDILVGTSAEVGQATALTALGYAGRGRMPQAGPWRLQFTKFSEISGLSSVACPGSHVLMNAAAVQAGWD